MAFYSDVKTLEDKQNMHEFAKMGLMPELGQNLSKLTNDVDACFFEVISEKINEFLFMSSAIIAASVVAYFFGCWLMTF